METSDVLRCTYPENVFVWTTKKNVRQLEKVLKKIPEISDMSPSVIIENVRSDLQHYAGFKIKTNVKIAKGQKGFAVQVPYGFDLPNFLPAWVNSVVVTDTDKDVTVFKPVTPEQFFVNKKGKAI